MLKGVNVDLMGRSADGIRNRRFRVHEGVSGDRWTAGSGVFSGPTPETPPVFVLGPPLLQLHYSGRSWQTAPYAQSTVDRLGRLKLLGTMRSWLGEWDSGLRYLKEAECACC